uniref:Uncharacterized protein n=1 Tax=Salix viminalis TaxID=40686 RepID=A0A6N2N8E5_SALVM
MTKPLNVLSKPNTNLKISTSMWILDSIKASTIISLPRLSFKQDGDFQINLLGSIVFDRCICGYSSTCRKQCCTIGRALSQA